jgi:hypothetical protein
MDSAYQIRNQEFSEGYEESEGDDIISLVIATGEWLEKLLLDREMVENTMNALLLAFHGGANIEDDRYEGDDWRERWQNMLYSNNSDFQSTQLMTALNAYGFWGLYPDCAYFGFKTPEGGAKIDDIGRVVALGRTLLDAIPSGWGTDSYLSNTIQAAEARYGIDAERDITPAQLASLARLSLKSIKNLSTPANPAAMWKLTPEGKVPWKVAKTWLETREGFKTSVWHLVDSNDLHDQREISEDLEDVVFVPMAKDGSIFDPVKCKTSGGYTIGKKGAEEQVEDYLTALRRLSKMPTPYWRRPNAVGNRNLVSGVSWQRKTLEELGINKDDEEDA